ncbi:cation-transporting P-type ATPase [Niveibacterium sp. 24ML]|uniref:cation-translocating P-type ATPase n=1 Tax=Niveibacterium sp. 24ML TaxID=2985512 RepID=UPI00226DE8FD|nr:cation-transporting P-type ATPase [Niveibacterium sp. 24ML]MCX9155717.1 cation-transporting P-type ATPase [Niveibacterium sp. 24ML]
MTHIAHLTPEAALASLRSSPQGLSAADVARRTAEYGANQVEAARRESVWLVFLREFTHFFALILWIGAALALLADYYQPGEGMHALALAILGVILINGVFSFWQSWRAERALAALRGLLPQQVIVIRDGIEQTIEAVALVPGDIVLIAEGDRVPADCRILESTGIRVNLATLTGEAYARAGVAEAASEPDVQAARNLLRAGTLVVSGRATALVFATGMHTEFGRIAHLTQTAGEVESPLQREIRHVSRIVALIASGLGVVFFLIGHAVGLPFWDTFMFAIGVIVANVPEGLLPTVTLSLAMATQRMAKRNALVRHLPAVEALGSTTVICSDKTGTLTENRMKVARWHVWQGVDTAPAALREVAGQCHDLRFPPTGASGDSMELALWAFGGKPALAPRTGELPFDADRRRMSVMLASAEGSLLLCKGAPESVLPCCATRWTSAGEVALDAHARAHFAREQDAMATAGLRVLACAGRHFKAGEPIAEAGLCLYGLIGLEDPPRADVAEAVARCHGAGIRVIMITGDHPGTALAIARQIGLVRGASPSVLRGDAVRKMTPAQLQLALDAPEVLFARVSAEQKMLVVQALQRKGEIVAVTGDGVNDAPALKTADIGIAMGLSGTDVAKEAADLVLLDDHFGSIVNAVEEGRAVFENLRKFLTYILTSNIPEVVPYLAFVLLRIPLPLTVIQILAVDLGTDLVPALALGAEPPREDVMRQPPRRRGERLLSWPVLLRAYLWLGMIQGAVSMAAFFLVLHLGGWQWGQSLARHDPLYLSATTACLAAIVAAQVANLFVCRDPLAASWRLPLRKNPLLLVGLVCELGLLALIVYTPAGQLLFGTTALPAWLWLVFAGAAALLFVLEETRKFALRGRLRRHGACQPPARLAR